MGPAGGTPGKAAGEIVPQEIAEVAAGLVAEAEVVPAEAAEPPPEVLDPVAPPETVAALAPEAVPLYAPVGSVPDAAAVEASELEVPEVVPAETVLAEVAMPVPPLPRAKPQPPQVATPAEPKPVEAAAAPAAEPEETATAEAVTPAGAAASSTAATRGPSKESVQSGTEGKAGTGARAASGTTESRSGGSNPGAVVDYAARLNAWLERHKEYPRRASLRRQQGEATLYFIIDRAGRVLDFRIEKSTGYKLLDEEVVNMIRRASPLPAPPESIQGAALEFRVPVGFDQH